MLYSGLSIGGYVLSQMLSNEYTIMLKMVALLANNIGSLSSLRAIYGIVNLLIALPGISLLVAHIYKQPLFCTHFSFFLQRLPLRTKSPLFYLERFDSYFIFCFFSLIYPPFSYKTSFIFSSSNSSQNFRLTLFRLILLPSNFCIRRYKYSSLILNPIIISSNITSTAV